MASDSNYNKFLDPNQLSVSSQTMLLLPPSARAKSLLATIATLYGAAIAALHHLYLTHPALDPAILNRIHTQATLTLTTVAKTLSFIGSPRTLWPTVLLAAFLLWRNRLHPQAAFLLATMAASGLLETLVKLAARRTRPAVPWAYVHENTYSFPSGHATLALALYASLIYLTRHRPTAQRLTLATFAVAMTLAIALSRLYLGVHNPTDVLAGYLTGAACVLTVILLSPLQNRPPG